MGVLAVGLQLHEVDDVDHPDLELGHILAQELHGCQRLQRGHVAGARHDDVRLAVLVTAGPFPDADPRRAVPDRLVHGQPLGRRMLAGHDDIDVVLAAQTVVGDGQQTVGIRRQVDADDLGLLVDDMIDEAGVLVAEAVVVLPPDVRGEQDIKRGEGAPPGDLPGHLQPLRMLIEHRANDVNESLVAGEQAMAAREHVALQPSLALVLAQHLEDAPVRGEMVITEEGIGHPLPLRDLEDRVEAVRDRLIRPEEAEVPLRRVQREHVAQETAQDAGIFGPGAPWARRAAPGARGRCLRPAGHRRVAGRSSP